MSPPSTTKPEPVSGGPSVPSGAVTCTTQSSPDSGSTTTARPFRRHMSRRSSAIQRPKRQRATMSFVRVCPTCGSSQTIR